RRDDAAQRPYLLLGESGTLQHVTQGFHHMGTLFRRAEKSRRFEGAFEVVEEVDELLLARRRIGRTRERQARRLASEHSPPPLISDDKDGLSNIQRSEGRVARKGKNLVGERAFLVGEPDPLSPEENRHRLPLGH